jgi:acetyl-CoA carboxylase carboxyltransferase component
MCSRHLGADFVFAWPTAEIAVMGPEGAANIIFRSEINGAEDPSGMRRQKVSEYTEKFANPYVAAASGHIDAVVPPAETRKFLLHAMQISKQKTDSRPQKKHGIPPF